MDGFKEDPDTGRCVERVQQDILVPTTQGQQNFSTLVIPLVTQTTEEPTEVPFTSESRHISTWDPSEKIFDDGKIVRFMVLSNQII